MKKYLALLAVLTLWSNLAFSQANALIYQMRNSTDTNTLTRNAVPPNAHAFLFSDQSSKIPRWGTFGPTCSIALGTLDCHGVQSDFNATSGPSFIQNLPSSYPTQRALISDATTFGKDWIALADLVAAKSTLGVPSNLSDLNNDIGAFFDGAYTSLSGVPSTFTPAAHNQAWSTITSTPTTLDGYGISDTGTAALLNVASTGDASSSQVVKGDDTRLSDARTPTSHTHTVSQVTDFSSAIAGKFDTPAGTTSQVVLGDGTLGGLPVPQVTQRIRVQTNASGAYTWTFPTAYGSGVTPIVSVTVEDGSSAMWNHQISTPTNTSVTVQLSKTTAVTVLGVSVLGLATTPQAYIHITAIAP